MDDFIIQGSEPIIKVDSLGIGITEGDVQKLSLSDTEYLDTVHLSYIIALHYYSIDYLHIICYLVPVH